MNERNVIRCNWLKREAKYQAEPLNGAYSSPQFIEHHQAHTLLCVIILLWEKQWI